MGQIVNRLAVVFFLWPTACAPRTDAERFRQGVAAYDGGDYASAHAAWRDGAARDDLAALRNLGLLYEKGLGVKKDAAQAAAYYRRAAEKGLLGAQLNLARLYANRAGGAYDPAAAYRWYGVAARQGSRLAAFEAAKLLYHGRGIAADPKTARAIIARLSAEGFAAARDWLANRR